MAAPEKPPAKAPGLNSVRATLSSQTLMPLGLVVAIIAALLTGAGAYYTLAGQVAHNCDAVDALDERYVPREVLVEKLARIDERQARMERTLDRVAERLGAQ